MVGALRHGFDLVVYEGDPSRHHGTYFVVVLEEEITARKLVLWHRLAASAKKSILLSFVSQEGVPSPSDWALKIIMRSIELPLLPFLHLFIL